MQQSRYEQITSVHWVVLGHVRRGFLYRREDDSLATLLVHLPGTPLLASYPVPLLFVISARFQIFEYIGVQLTIGSITIPGEILLLEPPKRGTEQRRTRSVLLRATVLQCAVSHHSLDMFKR